MMIMSNSTRKLPAVEQPGWSRLAELVDIVAKIIGSHSTGTINVLPNGELCSVSQPREFPN